MRLLSYKRRIAKLERAITPAIPTDQEIVLEFVVKCADGSPGCRIRHRNWGRPNMTREYVDDRTGEILDSPPELPHRVPMCDQCNPVGRRTA
jgi:hypothetical protein